MSTLVTVKIGIYPNDLTMVKPYLEDSGITCYIKDENLSQVYSIGSAAIGGAKLQVREEDAERAIALLIEGGYAKAEDYELPESTQQLSKWYAKLQKLFSRNKLKNNQK